MNIKVVSRQPTHKGQVQKVVGYQGVQGKNVLYKVGDRTSREHAKKIAAAPRGATPLYKERKPRKDKGKPRKKRMGSMVFQARSPAPVPSMVFQARSPSPPSYSPLPLPSKRRTPLAVRRLR